MSFRELAAAAEVSPATLRHYFIDRAGTLEAVLASMHRQGLPHLAAAAAYPVEDARESLRWLLEALVFGWRAGVGRLHDFGLGAGLGHASLGPAYVKELLEPTLQAAEARIAHHVGLGELGPCNVRHAALELLSPVILGLLHQGGLGGAACRPLDLAAFLGDHLDRFLVAHLARGSSGPGDAA